MCKKQIKNSEKQMMTYFGRKGEIVKQIDGHENTGPQIEIIQIKTTNIQAILRICYLMKRK